MASYHQPPDEVIALQRDRFVEQFLGYAGGAFHIFAFCRFYRLHS